MSKPRGVPHCTANVFLLSLLCLLRTIQDLEGKVKDEGFERTVTQFVSENGFFRIGVRQTPLSHTALIFWIPLRF